MWFRLNLAGLVLAAACLIAPQAGAQTYPDRPLRIVVPIGPGGGYDFVGRLLADQLTKRLGQPVVVENKPGAGTIVGTQSVVTSPADGYTLLVGGLSNIVFNVGLYKKLTYDPLVELVPVALVYNLSYVLVGASDLPYSTAKQIIEAAKKNPEALKLANAGQGTGQHLVGAAFIKFTGARMLEVPYKSSPAVFADLLPGRVDLFFDSITGALPHIKAGRAKGIAILASKRSPILPDVPTMTESGVPNLEIDSWVGLFAPAKTPPAIIARLQREIAAALPELKERIEASGGTVVDMAPDKLGAFIKVESDRWLQIIRETGIQLD